jgi:hypothetical protein
MPKPDGGFSSKQYGSYTFHLKLFGGYIRRQLFSYDMAGEKAYGIAYHRIIGANGQRGEKYQGGDRRKDHNSQDHGRAPGTPDIQKSQFGKKAYGQDYIPLIRFAI